MQILRIPPFPLYAEYSVPEPNAQYVFTIENAPRTIEAEVTLVSDANSKIKYELTGDFVKYDHNYAVLVYDTDGDVVVQDVLNIMKPYVNPYMLAEKYGSGTASEVSEYMENEQLARGLIDSVIGPKGLIFEKTVMEVVGEGTDYLPLWDMGYKVLQVYENGDLVYDVNAEDPSLGKGFVYGITQDRSAIYKEYVPAQIGFNRAEKRPRKLPRAVSDSYRGSVPIDSANQIMYDQPVLFPEGWDYVVIYEAGYKVIPHDIEDATTRLIDDIKCGKLDYAKRYVTDYRTDQFSVTIDTSAFQGTGNNFVDRILQRYIVSIYKPRVI
jgi:hypothetical protein